MSKKDYVLLDGIKKRTGVCFWLNLASALIFYLFFSVSKPADFSIWMSFFMLAAMLILAFLNFQTLFQRHRNKIVYPHRKLLISWSLLSAAGKFVLAMVFASVFKDSIKIAEAYILCFVGIDTLYFELVGLFGTKLKFRHLLLQFGVFLGLIVLSSTADLLRSGMPNKYALVYTLSFIFGLVFACVLVGYILAKLLLRFVYKPLKQAGLEEKEREKNPVFIKGRYFRSNAVKIEKGKITAEPETIRGKKDKKATKKTSAKKSKTAKKTGKKKN